MFHDKETIMNLNPQRLMEAAQVAALTSQIQNGLASISSELTQFNLIAAGSCGDPNVRIPHDVDICVVLEHEPLFLHFDAIRELLGPGLRSDLDSVGLSKVVLWPKSRRQLVGQTGWGTLADTPADSWSIEGWGGLAPTVLKHLIQQTGMTLYSTSAVPVLDEMRLKPITPIPKREGYELFVVALRDLARAVNLIENQKNQFPRSGELLAAKAILRCLTAGAIAETGQPLSTVDH
jgi:hypothetical protein